MWGLRKGSALRVVPRDTVSFAAGVIVRRFAALANRRDDLCISPGVTEGRKNKYIDPYVLHPSEPSLAGDPDRAAEFLRYAQDFACGLKAPQKA
jgi:hypothetical protein